VALNQSTKPSCGWPFRFTEFLVTREAAIRVEGETRARDLKRRPSPPFALKVQLSLSLLRDTDI